MDKPPKSAYEIALEKLRAQDRERGERAPAPLSDGQKRRIAEARARCQARIAEREILFREERAKAGEDPEALQKLDDEHAAEHRRFEEERDREIEAIRNSGGKADGKARRSGSS
jgi:ABC-type polar amino acid transport system ATPase subunit